MMAETETPVPPTVSLSSYSPFETLERQYAAPVGRRVLLFLHLNGNACYSGGVEALLQQQPTSATATATWNGTESLTPAQSMDEASAAAAAPTSAEGAADPFSFLSQDAAPANSAPAAAGAATKSKKKGIGGFFSKVAQSTSKHLERGMTKLAIRADGGKSPDRLIVALLDDRGNLVSLTNALPVPLDHVRQTEGLRFGVPLYVPAALPSDGILQCQVYLKSGASAGLFQTKPFLVGISPRLTVSQLREAAATAPPTPPSIWTLPLQSSLVVDAKLTMTVLPDPKLPALCGPGWSLADPSAQGYTAGFFDYPLDQSYALNLTFTPATAVLPTTNAPPPPPPATSLLACTERTTESALVLPLATAWWQHLVAPAVQVSYRHAQGVAATVIYQRQDSPAALGESVETHVTMHHLHLAPNVSVTGTMRRLTVHCQRPDSIFEAEWGGGPVGLTSEASPSSVPPPATVLAYPKPVRQDLLPALQSQTLPPHGYRLGQIRLQAESTEAAPASLWEGWVDLDHVLAHQQSGQVLRIPMVLAENPTVIAGHLAVTICLTHQAGQTALPVAVAPQMGLVALVGLQTSTPVVQPAWDALSSVVASQDEQQLRRVGQLKTMGFFYTQAYVDFHMQQVRPADSNAMAERAAAYQSALQQTPPKDRLPPYQDRTPRAFRPSSSRLEAVLSGIPFNCHTASLQVSMVTQQEKRDSAYFYNITCGAPADHARGFGNIFRKEVDWQRVGLTSPVGPVSGGLRRLEAKRLEIMKHVDDLQTMLIMQVANYFVTERQKRKLATHVPAGDAELQGLRWKLFEAVQSLHHTTWTCAVRRANVFSQALGLAVTCFMASLSDAAKSQSTWPELWAKQGFLVNFEGLLSAAGKELGMIEDASVGIDMLKNVQLVLIADDGCNPNANGRVAVAHSPYLKWVQISTSNQTDDGPTEYLVHLGILPSYYDQRIPVNFKQGSKIRFYPLLFEVGVDIRQFAQHAINNNLRKSESGEDIGSTKEVSAPAGLLDDEDDDTGVEDDDVLVQLNFEAFQKLNTYAHRISPANSPNATQKIHPLLETLHEHIMSSSGKINHDILDEAATLSQQLGGGAVVFCKSGKDRTAMHVTYKQAQYANRYKRHWSPEANAATILEACLEDATTIRIHGTRLPICEKNVGQAKYAFNSLQVKFMPDKLKPPMKSLAGFLKGGKVFSSGGGIES